MSSTIVFSTTTESARRQQQARQAVARMREAADRREQRLAVWEQWADCYTYGLCTRCGAVETALTQVTGIRDLSHLGEAPDYPTGYGCELCD